MVQLDDFVPIEFRPALHTQASHSANTSQGSSHSQIEDARLPLKKRKHYHFFGKENSIAQAARETTAVAQVSAVALSSH